MAWLAENWVWVLIGIAFIGLHLFGHGGHGGHGGSGESSRRPRNENEKDQPGRHRH